MKFLIFPDSEISDSEIKYSKSLNSEILRSNILASITCYCSNNFPKHSVVWSGLARMKCSAPGSFAGTRGARLRIACPFVDCFPSSSPRQLFFVLGCWACAHGAARVKPRSSQRVLRSRLLPRQQRASDRHLAGACGGVGGFLKSRRRAPGVFCFFPPTAPCS